MKTSKSFNQEYIEKAKTLIHEILEDKKEYDDWTQICFSIQNAVQAAANIWGISSDEQINKMRAFITEMVLTELSNLKQFDIVFKKKGIRSLDTLYCPKCGSNNVEERAWVNPNTDEITSLHLAKRSALNSLLVSGVPGRLRAMRSASGSSSSSWLWATTRRQ